MYILFLTIHIFSGGLSLLLGTWNLLQKKGNISHKKVGLIFVWGMLITGFTAFVLAILKSNVFLFIIGIFTVYLVGTGQRYIHLKKIDKGQVIASGNHQDLLSSSKEYKNFYDKQIQKA